MSNQSGHNPPKLIRIFVLCWGIVLGVATYAADRAVSPEGLASGQAQPATAAEQTPDPTKQIPVSADSFICLQEMVPVRGFFIANLLGESELKNTITVATNAPEGGSYPAGSVVQLIPTEVMVKHQPGWNPETNDWEFFQLEVSKEGSKIKVKGTTDVINKFGGNCFECHKKARPEYDLICEEDHGCDPLPIPDFIIRMTQKRDPRCD
jgi:hypothetical protein